MKEIGLAMIAGTWTRRSHRELAAAWGVHPSTVRRWSAEASRAVRTTAALRVRDAAESARAPLLRAREDAERISDPLESARMHVAIAHGWIALAGRGP